MARGATLLRPAAGNKNPLAGGTRGFVGQPHSFAGTGSAGFRSPPPG